MTRNLLVLILTLTIGAATLLAQHGSMSRDIVDTAVAAGQFKTLAAALEAADLVGALKDKGPFTVFAPTDQAFNKLPQGLVEDLLRPENRDRLTRILTYHAVPGRITADRLGGLRSADTLNGQRLDISVNNGEFSIDKSRVIQADILADNGVIHVIDRVLIPAERNIVATAAAAGTFNTLATALKAANLDGALSGEGPFTVFAPTDEAFSKLPASILKSLLQPENRDQLIRILKYHVVPGRNFANQALRARTVRTLAGLKVQVSLESGRLQVNGSGIEATDVEASNGVIHVIETVLIPNDERAQAIAVAELIRTAIERGVPQFNKGRTTACRDIYELAARAILDLSPSLPQAVTSPLAEALESIGQQHRSRDQAWTLRRGLDSALNALDSMMTADVN